MFGARTGFKSAPHVLDSLPGFVWEWCGNRKRNIIRCCYFQFHFFSLCECIYLLGFKTCDIESRYCKFCAQFYFVKC